MLTRGLVQNVYAVPAAVSTRDSSTLTVKTDVERSKVAELAHWILYSAKATCEAKGNGALNTSMSGRTARSEARSLQGENLIGSKLLLIKCLLLLLQRFDLLLNSDLPRNSVADKRQHRCIDLPVRP